MNEIDVAAASLAAEHTIEVLHDGTHVFANCDWRVVARNFSSGVSPDGPKDQWRVALERSVDGQWRPTEWRQMHAVQALASACPWRRAYNAAHERCPGFGPDIWDDLGWRVHNACLAHRLRQGLE